MAVYLSDDLEIDDYDLLVEVLKCDLGISDYDANYLGDGLYFVVVDDITREQVEEINFRYEKKLKERYL